MNNAMIESYLRNLLGCGLGAISIVVESTGMSPVEFGVSEWLLVTNAIWAAVVPTLIRYLNKKDPAFGLVAQVTAQAVTAKLETAAKEAAKTTLKAPAKRES